MRCYLFDIDGTLDELLRAMQLRYLIPHALRTPTDIAPRSEKCQRTHSITSSAESSSSRGSGTRSIDCRENPVTLSSSRWRCRRPSPL